MFFIITVVYYFIYDLFNNLECSCFFYTYFYYFRFCNIEQDPMVEQLEAEWVYILYKYVSINK